MRSCCLLGGTDTLALSVHVAFLGFLQFGEMPGGIFDVDQRPRVIIASPYDPEPRFPSGETRRCGKISDCWFNAEEFVDIVDVFVAACH